MATDTVYAGSADGEVYCQDAVYETARSGSGTLAVQSDATRLRIGQYWYNAGSCYYIYQGFLPFDLSSYSASDEVTAATIYLSLVSDYSYTDFNVEVYVRDWGATLEGSDFVPGGNLGGLTLIGSLNSSGIGATGTYKTITLNAAGRAAVKAALGGTLRVLLASSRQRTDTPTVTNSGANTDNESLQFAAEGTAGTSNDPKLTFTHNAVQSRTGAGLLEATGAASAEAAIVYETRTGAGATEASGAAAAEFVVLAVERTAAGSLEIAGAEGDPASRTGAGLLEATGAASAEYAIMEQGRDATGRMDVAGAADAEASIVTEERDAEGGLEASGAAGAELVTITEEREAAGSLAVAGAAGVQCGRRTSSRRLVYRIRDDVTVTTATYPPGTHTLIGHITLTVGGLDLTYWAEGMRVTSELPGGFKSLTFRARGSGLPESIAPRSVVRLTMSGAVLFEGRLASTANFDVGEQQWFNVEAEGNAAKLRDRGDYYGIYIDSDTSQWAAHVASA